MFLWIPRRNVTRSKVTGNVLVNAVHAFHRFNRIYHVEHIFTISSEVDLSLFYPISFFCVHAQENKFVGAEGEPASVGCMTNSQFPCYVPEDL